MSIIAIIIIHFKAACYQLLYNYYIKVNYNLFNCYPPISQIILQVAFNK